MAFKLTYAHWQYRLHEIIFEADTRACPGCTAEGHDPDALFCKFCSAQLNPFPGEEISR